MTPVFWAALLGALPELLKLLTAVAGHATAAQAQGQGYDQAVKDGLLQAAAGQQAGIDATNAADARQRAHPGDDTGFDPQFRRD